MTGTGHAPAEVSIMIDTPHPARMFDYLLGGRMNFKPDRAAVGRAAAAMGGISRARADVRANRDFLGRAVRYLIADAGIRQFLDIGIGIPNGVDDTHAVIRQLAPESRVVYVDNDPIVLANAHTLRHTPHHGGATEFVQGDLREPSPILEQAAVTLDFTQPVGLVLVAALHFISDDQEPHRLVRELTDALPADSHVALSHLTGDFEPEAVARLVEAINEQGRDTFVPRMAADITHILGDAQLVDPGLVQVGDWWPDPDHDTPPPEGWTPSFYGAVARTTAPGPT